MSRNAIQRLFVRAPNWIGDAVMCEPALRGLRSLFPQATLTVLAKPGVAELYAGYAGVDRVALYDAGGIHAGLAGKWALAETLRRQRFDLAVLFQNAFEAAFLTWLAGIPRRFGYATDGRAFLLTDPVAVPDPGLFMHQVSYYWNLLKPLGLAGEPPAPSLTLLPGEEQVMEERLALAGIGSSDLVIGVNPGSTNGRAKRWLPSRFAEAAQRVAGHLRAVEGKDVAVVILGAKGEEELGREIAAGIAARSAVFSGATTVRELMALAKRCRLLLTNDTGPMHIAAALGVPVVAVFGPTDWRKTSPYGQEGFMVREQVECAPCFLRECPIDHRCMNRVSVDRVYETALSRLSHDSPPSHSAGFDRRDAQDGTGRIGRTDRRLCGFTVFLDRDGTLNPDLGYIRSPDQYELFPGAPQALARLKQAGAQLVLVTNQSGVGRGLFSIEELDAIHAKLGLLLKEAGASLDAIYVCPHRPEDACECRKPKTGLIDRAVRERKVDLSRSYLIGDHARDMELAKRVGSRSVLVTTGAVTPRHIEGLRAAGLVPDLVASSLEEAADWLLSDAGSRLLIAQNADGS